MNSARRLLLKLILLLPLVPGRALAGESSREAEGRRASARQVAEVYRFLRQNFLKRGDRAAIEALDQLKEAADLHRRAHLNALAALDRYARSGSQGDRLDRQKAQLELLQQTVQYQYLLQMLWLDPLPERK